MTVLWNGYTEIPKLWQRDFEKKSLIVPQSPYTIYFRSFSIAPFSRRDTCAWLMPISEAISICVRPL